LSGALVRRVGRYGKLIVWELDRGWLVVELRMTGVLLWRREPGPYTRAQFVFEHGAVSFDDIRQFGSVQWRPEAPGHLGADALEIGKSDLACLLDRRRRLKPLLLDQHVLRGLGNISVDEILYRARIHPGAVAGTLRAARIERLHEAMRGVLLAAIAAGGSSISDYVDADGQPGRYQLEHRVYGREGRPCDRCGAPIRRIVVAQRGTHYCPHCQRT
jgi:formamidopyrimidine-DNA glycosylase